MQKNDFASETRHQRAGLAKHKLELSHLTGSEKMKPPLLGNRDDV